MKEIKIVVCVLIIFLINGCTVVFKKAPPEEVRKAKQLKRQVEDLSTEIENLRQQREREITELVGAKKLLEERLKKEIKDKQVKLELARRGLVITFVAEVLFDSGKAKLKPEAFSTLDKVARVLQEEMVARDIGIEGHTDNRPIKYSGWKSNWELSSARALSVLHYLVDKRGIRAQRVSARGYGEYRPVASNATRAGRQKNRRVEIVILPKATQGIEKRQEEEEEIEYK